MSDAPKLPESAKEALLDHEVRQALYELVQDKPGLNQNQLADELSIYLNRLQFHLERMVNHDLLVEVDGAQGQEVLVFHPEQEELWQDPRVRVLFGQGAVRKVALYVAEHPGATSREIAEATDRSRDAVQHHLGTLREHELVESTRDGRWMSHRPGSALEWWYREVGDRYAMPGNEDEA